VDLLQLHSRIASTSSGKTPLSVADVTGPVADALDGLKREGKIRAAGFTGLGDPGAVLRAAESGRFDTVQAYVNVFNASAAYPGAAPAGEPDFAGLIPRAAATGLGVLAIRVLAAGAVSGSQRHANASAGGGSLVPGLSFDRDVDRSAQLAATIAALGLESAAELAIRFAISIAGVSTALVGFSSVDQVRDAVRYASRGGLAPAAADRIRALVGWANTSGQARAPLS
jgi:aryl-alcohol dehydrogenase-like predicted oxidoreductase